MRAEDAEAVAQERADEADAARELAEMAEDIAQMSELEIAEALLRESVLAEEAQAAKVRADALRAEAVRERAEAEAAKVAAEEAATLAAESEAEAQRLRKEAETLAASLLNFFDEPQRIESGLFVGETRFHAFEIPSEWSMFGVQLYETRPTADSTDQTLPVPPEELPPTNLSWKLYPFDDPAQFSEADLSCYCTACRWAQARVVGSRGHG